MIGTSLQDRYLLESELGRGGMGVAYRAHDTLLDWDIAVKLVSSETVGTEGQSRLLQVVQEVRSLQRLRLLSPVGSFTEV